MQSVKTIAVSKPVIDDIATPGDLVAYAARVSNPANQANTETAPRLLAYLAQNAHWSPFEMAHMTLEIVTTRDIARQILRHRSFAFQEFSQRYAEVVAADYINRQCRLQHPTNRQASLEGASDDNIAWFNNAQDDMQDTAIAFYDEAIARGIAKEQARVFLPEGLTKSTMYMAGSIRSWIHYIQLRTEAGTQKEHREIAEMCKIELLKHFPELAGVQGVL
jgi:thymidylate synthase (FAD)